MSQEKERVRPSDREVSYWYTRAITDAVPTDIEEGSYNPQPESRAKAVTRFKPVKPIPEGTPLVRAIEDDRMKFREAYKTSRIFSYVIIGVLVALIVATIAVALVANLTKATWGNYVIWPLFALVIVVFVVSVIFSSVSKKKDNYKLSLYLDSWENDMAASAYVGQNGVADLQYSIEAKVRDADLINTHYWAVINSIDSRNRVVFTLNGVACSDTEVIVETPVYSGFAEEIEEAKANSDTEKPSEREPEFWYSNAEGKRETQSEDYGILDKVKKISERAPNIGAFGKFIASDFRSDGGSLIVVRKVSDTYLPTHVKGLRFLPDVAESLGEDFVVWASDREFAKDVLTQEVRDQLLSLEPNGILVDWFLSYNPHGCYAMLNYSDDIMELPFKGTPKASRLKNYSDDVGYVLTVLRNLSRKAQ